MKTLKFLFTALLITVFSISVQANDRFKTAMLTNLEAWGKAKSPADYEQVRNKFVRIGDAEKTQWLPYYYAAQMYILEGFRVKDKAKIKLLLDQADQLMDKAAQMDGAIEAEFLILKGLRNTVLVASDPAVNGPKLSAPTMALYKKALALDPKNPRATYLSAEFEMGAAKFFGKPLDPYCKKFDEALELFKNEKPKSEIHPAWGKSRLLTLIKQCQANAEKDTAK